MQKKCTLILAMLLLVGCLAGCGGQAAKDVPITSLSQLNSKEYTVGVGMGTADIHVVEENLPNAEMLEYTSAEDAYIAVQAGVLDAFAFSREAMLYAMSSGGLKGVTLLDETIGEGTDVVIGISPKTTVPGLREKANAFLASIREDGTFDELYTRWVINASEVMPEIPKPEHPDCRIIVGTSGEIVPFSYYKGSELTGMDLEMIARFALFLNAEVEIVVMDYTGLSAASEAGTIDCVFANLHATPERAEAMDFSDPIYKLQTALMVRSEDAAAEGARVPRYASLSEMKSSDIALGVEVGSNFEEITRREFPNAEIKFFDTVSDIANSITSGKLDGYIGDEPVVRMMCANSPKLTCIDEPLETNSYACVFPKTPEGQALCDEVSEFIRQCKADGRMQEIIDAWLSDDRAAQRTDYASLSGENGTIRMAASFEVPPFSFFRDGVGVGMDLDLMIRFCEAKGCALEVVNTNFAAIIPSLGTTCDIGVDGFCITPERAEEVLFSEPYYVGGTLMLIGTEEGTAVSPTFWQSLSASFEKTFIREQRWKMIVEGIGTTVFISFFSALFGTLLGFGICLLRRLRSRVVFGITTVYIRILQGTPLVVLLMVLYYLVFPKSGLRGEWVAVIAFALNFAAYVSEMMRTGIEAVDIGQTEAALALGFPKGRAFFKFILPQAARHFLPVYKGEFISLVKMTSIVGYIAVQDLTKMSDIIRSRTYEAFFPLIATALIYFLISWLLSTLLRLAEIRIEPDRKNRTVKGVKLQ